MYLYLKKASVDVNVIYIPKPMELKIPEIKENKLPEFMEEATSTMIEIETFDYETLIAYSMEIIEASTEVSTFVLDSNDALKIIRVNKEYLINKLNNDKYFVVIPGKHTYPGLIPGKSVYTIFLKTGENSSRLFEDLVNLRILGYEAYVLKFSRNTKTYFTLCLGAFPDKDSASEAFNKIDWDKLREHVYTYGPYVGRITP
ncbi:hypothetical protein [Thermosipho atlanticus]|uniref:Sporulation related domain-containing protein n=1 Tax=Thermosipho atlanticus DSM 15807 TaxID=1123380 RepID=A0A1M5RXX0_9BACT|nr:hypothetical protein [Thermosipho atlanticus]SHH30868.1 hypothetical protein SAMN02745199_0674 [Thermosipho atlanticus DSM 15807]